jgi:hypothetical protein
MPPFESEQPREIVDGEVGVFEEREQPEIEDDPGDEHGLASKRRQLPIREGPASAIIDQNRGDQDRRVRRQYDRKKSKQEISGHEQHENLYDRGITPGLLSGHFAFAASSIIER